MLRKLTDTPACVHTSGSFVFTLTQGVCMCGGGYTQNTQPHRAPCWSEHHRHVLPSSGPLWPLRHQYMKAEAHYLATPPWLAPSVWKPNHTSENAAFPHRQHRHAGGTVALNSNTYRVKMYFLPVLLPICRHEGEQIDLWTWRPVEATRCVQEK